MRRTTQDWVRCLLRSARMEVEVYGEVMSPSLRLDAVARLPWPPYETHPESARMVVGR